MADGYIDKVEVGAKIQMMYIRREMDYGGENDFCRGMRKALRIIENMPAADVQPISQWISVKDRLPDEDGWYLVCKHNRVRVAEWCKDCWYNESDLPIDDCAITYWQPLPELPKDGNVK